jgi:hypothetical protein
MRKIYYMKGNKFYFSEIGKDKMPSLQIIYKTIIIEWKGRLFHAEFYFL